MKANKDIDQYDVSTGICSALLAHNETFSEPFFLYQQSDLPVAQIVER